MHTLRAQSAPPVEWDFESPSTIPGFELDDNWVYTPIQASDGSIVAAGFSDKYNTTGNTTTGYRHPAVIKYIPGPVRKIQWESIPTYQYPLGINIANSGKGGFVDLFEQDEGGTRYIYACGIIVEAGNASRVGVIAKFRLSDGGLIYFKKVTGFANMRLNQMIPISSGNSLSAIYVAGESQVNITNKAKATIFKFKPDGTLDNSFDGDGWRQYSASAPYADRATYFTDFTKAPDVANLGEGFIAVGAVVIATNGNQDDRDVFMVRLRADNGNLPVGGNWPRRFSEASLGALYTDLNAPEAAVCTGHDPETTLNEEGTCVRRMPDGNFAVVCRFDFVNQPAANLQGCYPFDTEQLYDNDVALVKIDQVSGAPLYTLDIGRSIALDGSNFMDVAPGCSEMYICANNYFTSPQTAVVASVIRVDDLSGSFSLKWRKDVASKHWEYCVFGICLTTDQGVVVCGNNGADGDNYEFIKLSNDRQHNFNYTQGGLNISSSVLWNTTKKIKGIIRIQSGGTLTIENTTIEFANTSSTNNWFDLAQGGGIPTKIIVEPNGKLILRNCILKGLNTSLCPSGTQEGMWEGIQVLGQPGLSQSFANQGYVEMGLNAQISNAYMGIHFGSTAYNADGRSGSTGNDGGGMLKCQNPSGATQVHFLNCRRALWFAPVSHNSTPLWPITNTNFTCNLPMADVNFVDPEGSGLMGWATQVSSWNRDGLTFNNCAFRNTGNFKGVMLGLGAGNFDARMIFNTCRFINLYEGINANYGSGVSDPTIVLNCDFDQVYHGALISGGALHLCSGNNFTQIPKNLPNDNSYGLRFVGSTNISVSESNSFSSLNPGTYGVIVKDALNNASEIVRNTFSNIRIGVQTEQNNTGLQIRCNSFSNHQHAWSINPASTPNTAGLFSNQGSCGTTAIQAGNIFSDPDCPGTGIAESHIRSKLNFAYRARSGASYNSNEIPTCISQGPSGSNGIVTVNLCAANSNINACLPPPPNTQDTPGGWINVTKNDPWEEQNLGNFQIRKALSEGDTALVEALFNQLFDADSRIILDFWMNTKQYNKVRERLGSMPEKGYNSDLIAYYEVLLELAQSGKNFWELWPSHTNKLLKIAHGGSPVRYSAQNILAFYKGYHFDHAIEQWSDSDGLNQDNLPETNQREGKAVSISALNVFPNPSNGLLVMQWEAVNGLGIAQIFNAVGDLQVQRSVDLGLSKFEFNLSELPTGFYIIRLNAEGNILQQKFYLQNNR